MIPTTNHRAGCRLDSNHGGCCDTRPERARAKAVLEADARQALPCALCGGIGCQVPAQDEPPAQRGPASYLYEDYLVAQARFGQARKRTLIRHPGRRPQRSRSKEALADIAIHQHTLVELREVLDDAGGEVSLTGPSKRYAARIAALRLKNGDIAHGVCQCGRCDRKPWTDAPRKSRRAPQASRPVEATAC